jgi:hypothetical protein
MAQMVGGGADFIEFVTACFEQPDDVTFGERLAGDGAIENFL